MSKVEYGTEEWDAMAAVLAAEDQYAKDMNNTNQDYAPIDYGNVLSQSNADMGMYYGSDSGQISNNNEPTLAPEEQAGSNMFAQIFRKIATVVGKDSAIGARCLDFADSIDERFSSKDAVPVSGTGAENGFESEMTSTDNTLSSDVQAGGNTVTPDAQASGDSVNFLAMETKDLSDEEKSNVYMAIDARTDVLDGTLAKIGQKRYADTLSTDMRMQSMSNVLSKNMVDTLGGAQNATLEDRKQVSDTYMCAMRGLSAYNQSALDEINREYQPGSESYTNAMNGLTTMMNRTVIHMMDNTAVDNKLGHFLSEENIAELDAMEFTGQTAKFSDYQARHAGVQDFAIDNGIDLNATDMALMDVSLDRDKGYAYEQVESYEDSEYTPKTNGIISRMTEGFSPTATAVNRGQFVDTKNAARTELAVNKFTTALENEAASVATSALTGMER